MNPRARTGSHPGLRRAPPGLVLLFAALLAAQIGLALSRPAPTAEPTDMPAPPATAVLRAASLGDPQLLSQWITLYLQSFDNQPGISIPFRALDYRRLAAWLEQALELDPRAHYPLLMASQLYTQVPDDARRRLMLDLAHRAFLADPERRWRWLAHGAIVARHQLHDPALALRYATDIALHARTAPGWARQMRIFLLEDLGEREHAKVLLGALLATGEVTDPAEIRFLAGRLEQLGDAGDRPAASPH